MLGFVLVLIIAVVAYGVFMHMLLFPDVTVSWQILFKVLFRPFLLVFGELGINSYTREYSCIDNTSLIGAMKSMQKFHFWKKVIALTEKHVWFEEIFTGFSNVFPTNKDQDAAFFKLSF